MWILPILSVLLDIWQRYGWCSTLIHSKTDFASGILFSSLSVLLLFVFFSAVLGQLWGGQMFEDSKQSIEQNAKDCCLGRTCQPCDFSMFCECEMALKNTCFIRFWCNPAEQCLYSQGFHITRFNNCELTFITFAVMSHEMSPEPKPSLMVFPVTGAGAGETGEGLTLP